MAHAFKNKSTPLVGLMAMAVWGGSPPAQAKEDAASGFSYTAYSRILAAHVDAGGFVDYASLQADRGDLDRFVARLGTLDEAAFRTWSAEDRIALWINAYNAFTLRAVVDHYPVKSIRDIGGIVTSVWAKLKFNVMGRTLTLAEIEHDILRKEYDEPRIHVAINCASIGCPPLLNRPYEAATLDQQFTGTARLFLGNPAKFRIDRTSNVVTLSPIFKWFGEDFAAGYGGMQTRKGHGTSVNAALNFVMQYVSEADKAFLREESFKLKWAKYDWDLNKQ